MCCLAAYISLTIVLCVMGGAEGGGATPITALTGPPECSQYNELFHQIWSDFAALAAHGPITKENVTDVWNLARKWSGWEYYFVELAIVEGKLFFRGGQRALGPWLHATLKLIALALHKHGRWVPDVYFVLSVLDEPYLERGTRSPLPLLAFMTTRGHWDIPVPSHAFFESSGGISSGDVKQDFQMWEKESWQAALAEKYPWDGRSERAFFRGHDWDSSNTFVELLQTRPRESCIDPSDASRSFGYRRWYTDLSAPGAALAEILDVNLTGAPSFVLEKYPGRKFAPPTSLPEHARHKYLLHLDGTAASNRLIKLMMLGSVVLKQDSVYEEYFYRNLQPYQHFLPFARDRCSTANLTDALAWLRSHDTEARKIAQAGQRYARRLLSTGAATCYWQRVLAVYGALQAFDPRLVIRTREFHEYHSKHG